MIRVFLFLYTCIGVLASNYNEYIVPCGTTNDYCDCPLEHNGERVDVCVFNLRIKVLQTFTRYLVEPNYDEIIVRNGGKVWYINETNGEYLPFPDSNDICTDTLDNPYCTQPLSVDGQSYRSVITINGHFPGPTLVTNYNQTLVMNVTNLMESQTTSIHFHGFHQRHTNWMDGVEQITQCGIAPGNTFIQIFQADPSGTFWYHSHTGAQRTEGIYGAIVIKELPSIMKDVHDILGSFNDLPGEHTMTLLDFYDVSLFKYYYLIHINTPLYFTDRSPDPSFYTPPNITKASDGSEVGPIPFWSALINGKGRHPNVDYTKSRLSIFTISPSNRYRFRVAGSQNGFGFRISVDEHKLLIISTDGALLKPVEVDYVIVQAGERYDFIINGKSELNNKYNYLIRAETLETYDPINKNDTRQPMKGHLAEAILHYDVVREPDSTQYRDIANNSIPIETRCTSVAPCIVLNCPFKFYPPSYNLTCIHVNQLELLFPLPDEALPDIHPDEYLFFNIGFEGSSQTSSFNARNNKMPSSPLSVLNTTQLRDLGNIENCRRLNDSSMCDDTLESVLASECICTHVRELPFNKSIQLVYSGVSPNPEFMPTYKATHPTHLHGHYFQVLDVQFGDYTPNGLLYWPNTNIYCGGAQKVCTVPQWSPGKDYSKGKKGKVSNTAPLKDSIAVPSGGYVVVYLRSDNPGHWFSHCHIENHQLAGMEVILSEASELIDRPPDNIPRRCGNVIISVSDYYKHMNMYHQSDQFNGSSDCNNDDDDVDGIVVLIGLIIIIISLSCIQTVLLYFLCFKTSKVASDSHHQRVRYVLLDTVPN